MIRGKRESRDLALSAHPDQAEWTHRPQSCPVARRVLPSPCMSSSAGARSPQQLGTLHLHRELLARKLTYPSWTGRCAHQNRAGTRRLPKQKQTVHIPVNGPPGYRTFIVSEDRISTAHGVAARPWTYRFQRHVSSLTQVDTALQKISSVSVGGRRRTTSLMWVGADELALLMLTGTSPA